MTGADPGAVHGVYCRQAARWDKERATGLRTERAWLDRLCSGLPAGAAVLDIGCGSGLPIAAELVRRGYAVTGIDFAAPMLDLARRNVPGATFALADMRTLALGREFRAVLAWDSFFHLAPGDQAAMFPVFAHHMAPGGRLLLTTGPNMSEVTGHVGGEPVYHASLAPCDYRRHMAANGIKPVEFRPEDPGSDFHSVWLAEKLASSRQNS